MVVRQQETLLVPVDGVVRVTNHSAVYESVPPSHCCDVLHGPDPRRSWWAEGQRWRLVDGARSRSWNFRYKREGGDWEGRGRDRRENNIEQGYRKRERKREREVRGCCL